MGRGGGPSGWPTGCTICTCKLKCGSGVELEEIVECPNGV